MERKEFDESLAKKRIVLLDGDIDQENVNRVRFLLAFLNTQSTEEIKLVIDSSGGSVEQGLFLFDALKLSKAPIIGIVNGRCDSTALVVLQGCKKRVATKHSLFFTHFISHSIKFILDEDFEKKISAFIEEGKRNQQYFEEILSQRTGKTVDKIKELMKGGEETRKILSSQEAKEIVLIDEVVEEYNLF